MQNADTHVSAFDMAVLEFTIRATFKDVGEQFKQRETCNTDMRNIDAIFTKYAIQHGIHDELENARAQMHKADKMIAAWPMVSTATNAALSIMGQRPKHLPPLAD